MPNTSVPAGAEGMPANRDPLLETIRAYRRAYEDFEHNHPREDDEATDKYADETYGPHLARLQQWRGPATSMEGAIEALRISLDDEGGVKDSDASDCMTSAALAYLENRSDSLVDKTKLLNAEDLVNECTHLSELVAMAIDGLELDAETKALSAGVYVIHRKLVDAAQLLELARSAAIAKDS